MKIESEIKLTFDDVMIKPKRSTLKSRADVDLNRTFKFKYSTVQWTGIPIIAANMDTIGTIEMANELNKYNMLTALHKFLSNYNELDAENNCFKNCILTVGEGDIINSENIKLFDFILVDVANGYRECLINYIKKLRKDYNNKIIIAGNVATREMTEALILAGADIIKVGIGPGAVCTTRKVTGVGYPQLSAISECADAAHGLNAHIIADGGCKYPGDLAKAFGAGADFIMLGGMLAGHKECEGEIIEKNNEQYKIFYGMSSFIAQSKHYESIAKYRASEGKVVKIKYKGPVENTIKEILGGLRSAHSYIGATNLKNFHKCCTFVRCTQTTNEVFS
jgi:GMP reductase